MKSIIDGLSNRRFYGRFQKQVIVEIIIKVLEAYIFIMSRHGGLYSWPS